MIPKVSPRDPAQPSRRNALESKGARFPIWLVLLALWGALLLQQAIAGRSAASALPYSEFRAAVSAGRVESVEVSPSTIRGHMKADTGTGAKSPARDFQTVRVDDEQLFAALTAAGVKVTGVADAHAWSETLGWLLPLVLFVGFWAWSLRRLRQGGGAGFLTVGRSKAKVYVEKDIAARFTDVAGVDEAKEELQEVVEFLRTPARFSRLGAHIPKGVLLVGPPGTGKTLLARAVAGEAGVPFFTISGSEFVEMFVGVGAARVRDLFEQAKTRAPCIIFIDELDALGKARNVGPMAHEEREQTLNQLLVEMDGFDPTVGVILMAATNRPEILDPALLRAGRFDRQVLVDRPDRAGRLAILRLHVRKIVLGVDADLEAIAGMTAGFVGADLANIVNEAALLGVRRGKDKVGRAELEEAVERVIGGLEKKNRVLLPKEKERVAHHEVGHALVSLALPGSDPVQKISIIPRGVAALGYTLQTPTDDRYLATRAELEGKLAILLGGRAAEEIIYDDVSTGAADDLAKATDIARAMVKAYGMSPTLGARTFESERRPLFLPGLDATSRGDYSDDTARAIDAEVRRIVEEQHARAQTLLRERLPTLRAGAERLLAKETLSGEELRALLPPA